jgi:hypothetical protein
MNVHYRQIEGGIPTSISRWGDLQGVSYPHSLRCIKGGEEQWMRKRAREGAFLPNKGVNKAQEIRILLCRLTPGF